MERMPNFDSRPQRNIDNSPFRLEYELGLRRGELTRYFYSPEDRKFNLASQGERREQRVEVMFHQETSTLVVLPPPIPGPLTMDALAKMTLPVVDFIKDVQPDIVIGCDRGARIFAVGVHSMWNKAEADTQRLPTLDGAMHFARLSVSLGQDVTSKALADILKVSQVEAKKRKKDFNGKRPRIMFIDDLVSSGRTKRHIMDSLDQLGVLSKIDVSFAIMCGPGADVSGSKDRISIPWHDNPDVIGVNYTKDGRVFSVRTEESRHIRRKVHRATGKLAAKLNR